MQKKITPNVIARLKESYPVRARELTTLSAEVDKGDSQTLFKATDKIPGGLSKNCPQ